LRGCGPRSQPGNRRRETARDQGGQPGGGGQPGWPCSSSIFVGSERAGRTATALDVGTGKGMHAGKGSAKETVSGPGHRSWSEESRIEHRESRDQGWAHGSCFMLHASRSRSTLNADACSSCWSCWLTQRPLSSGLFRAAPGLAVA
jgi:hypothetical protein